MLADKYTVETIKEVLAESRDNSAVDFSPKNGGICPLCGQKKCSIRCVGKWSGSVRERYHICRSCSHSFKSVEVDEATVCMNS